MKEKETCVCGHLISDHMDDNCFAHRLFDDMQIMRMDRSCYCEGFKLSDVEIIKPIKKTPRGLYLYIAIENKFNHRSDKDIEKIHSPRYKKIDLYKWNS